MPTSHPDALKSKVLHGLTSLKLEHHLGLENRDEGHSWILSFCSSSALWLVPALPCPHVQLLPPHHIPRQAAAAAAPEASVPVAAIGSPKIPFFNISAQSLHTWKGRNEHPHLSCGKTTEQSGLERKQGSKVLGKET